jgi:hypothetical protein
LRALIEYELVLDRMQNDGLKCNYPNGGAFGFPSDVHTSVRGWIGPPDPSIREGMRQYARSIGEPHVERLSAMAVQAWQQILPGIAWVMPGSHWSFELGHGSGTWLPQLLEEIGIDPRPLVERTTATAIQFLPSEEGPFETFLKGLLTGLSTSEFTLAFPERPVIGMIHHHKQLWWLSTNKALMDALDQIGAG